MSSSSSTARLHRCPQKFSCQEPCNPIVAVCIADCRGGSPNPRVCVRNGDSLTGSLEEWCVVQLVAEDEHVLLDDAQHDVVEANGRDDSSARGKRGTVRCWGAHHDKRPHRATNGHDPSPTVGCPERPGSVPVTPCRTHTTPTAWMQFWWPRWPSSVAGTPLGHTSQRGDGCGGDRIRGCPLGGESFGLPVDHPPAPVVQPTDGGSGHPVVERACVDAGSRPRRARAARPCLERRARTSSTCQRGARVDQA